MEAPEAKEGFVVKEGDSTWTIEGDYYVGGRGGEWCEGDPLQKIKREGTF